MVRARPRQWPRGWREDSFEVWVAGSSTTVLGAVSDTGWGNRQKRWKPGGWKIQKQRRGPMMGFWESPSLSGGERVAREVEARPEGGSELPEPPGEVPRKKKWLNKWVKGAMGKTGGAHLVEQ